VAVIQAEIGEALAAMQPVVTIDTSDEMWVEAALPAAQIGQVHAGDGVTVDGARASGVVTAAGTSIDPRTRSAMLRARLANAAGMVSGQTVRLTVAARAERGSFAVPRNAVVELRNGMAVFVRRGGGFEAVPVRVLARGAQTATVAGPLAPGEHVAVTGVSELKAAGARE
jgi:cobalt-zinc-cadmium efflux system membrane fusion protein